METLPSDIRDRVKASPLPHRSSRLAFWPCFWLVRTVSRKKGTLNT